MGDGPCVHGVTFMGDCALCSEQRQSVGSERYDWGEDPTAQDVIDAMRIAVQAQNDAEKAIGVVRELLEYAPDTMSNRGIDLLLRLISEAKLKFEMADH